MFPFNFMSTSFFIFGFLQAATGYAAVIFYKQEHFVINEENYKNIGSDPTRLVVFFSRMGYVRKKALEEANRTGAAVYEINPFNGENGGHARLLVVRSIWNAPLGDADKAS